MRLIIVLVLIAVGIVSEGLSAAAEPKEPFSRPTSTQARKLLSDGVAAFNAHDYEGALEKFLAALDIEQTGEKAGVGWLRLNTALTYRALRKWSEAKRYFLMLLEDGATLTDAARDDVRRRLLIATWFEEAINKTHEGNFAGALNYYQQILTSPDLSNDERTFVVSAIRDLGAQSVEDRTGAAATTTDPTNPPAAEPKSNPASEPEPSKPEPDRVHESDTIEGERDRGRGRSTQPQWYEDRLGWGVVGGGTAMAALGILFVAHAGTLDDEATVESNQDARSVLSDRAERYRVGGITSLAIGGAAITAGIVRLVLVPDVHPQLTPVVNVDDDGASMSVVGTF